MPYGGFVVKRGSSAVLVLAEPRICPNEAPAVDGAPLAVVPVATTAFVAVAPVVPVVVGVEPPQDAATTNANARTAELPLFTMKPPYGISHARACQRSIQDE